MKKSKFNLSHMHSTTLDAGYLVPFFCQSTLPNDTFYIGVNSFIRATPMLAPLMHRVFFYTQYWFVPYRLLWDNWEGFITGGDNLEVAPAFPVVNSGAQGFQVGSFADYLGFPVNQPNIEVSAMPFRAMALIWNERYRDEDIQETVPISFEDGLDDITEIKMFSPQWQRDYFTTARNSTQRGAEISVPVNNGVADNNYFREYQIQIGVYEVHQGGSSTQWNANSFLPKKDMTHASGTLPITAQQVADLIEPQIAGATLNQVNRLDATLQTFSGGRSITVVWRVISVTTNEGVQATNEWISDIDTNNIIEENDIYWGVFTPRQWIYRFQSAITSLSVDIRDLRLASSIQRYQERSLKWGNRYEEFIMREFGLRPRDARIDRPEYLGGSKSLMQISEVLQTAEDGNSGVGTMRGHAVAKLRNRRIRFKCPEHGVILGLMSIRPEPVYTQGIEREWLKRSRLDFFTPELADVGMQEVFEQELFATGDNKGALFGYQDRYNEYRFRKPMVTAEFRTGHYDFWNMARHWEQAPVLNSSFLDMSNSAPAFKRPFVEQTQHNFLAMIRNSVLAYRPIPKRAKNILK